MRLQHLVILTLLMVCQPVRAESFTVVAHADGLESYSRNDIAAIVRGEIRNWRNGSAIKVVLPSRKSRNYRAMCELFFSGSGGDLQRHWLSMVFSGRAAPPQFELSEQGALQYVRDNPGSIAVLLDEPAEDFAGLSVEVIR